MKWHIIILIFLLFSCDKKNSNGKVVISDDNSASYFRRKLENKKLMDSLDYLVMRKGDTLAYNELKAIHYIGEHKFTGFLYYALIMSNKYNYKVASFDVYDILTTNEKYLDKETRRMADEYLLKSKQHNLNPTITKR
ncbi:MAG: hypothetical protein REI96_11750 [Flavobacterium nitrogenifigens]|uniref:hypothetical protein n=1 Tax=Flavobacterium nitrogenifigens TaxID=1617283 RepID=UPI002806F4C0|nr:hypothetical protein [Flavobacterium nitrogenifigens]MDQ8013116.1 hypothetical protein [Flavobacterium nitrogenifigens]